MECEEQAYNKTSGQTTEWQTDRKTAKHTHKHTHTHAHTRTQTQASMQTNNTQQYHLEILSRIYGRPRLKFSDAPNQANNRRDHSKPITQAVTAKNQGRLLRLFAGFCFRAFVSSLSKHFIHFKESLTLNAKTKICRQEIKHDRVIAWTIYWHPTGFVQRCKNAHPASIWCKTKRRIFVYFFYHAYITPAHIQLRQRPSWPWSRTIQAPSSFTALSNGTPQKGCWFETNDKIPLLQATRKKQ